MTPEQYEKLRADQGYKCAICQRPEESFSKRFAVDHSHTTGEVRGALCTDCNANLIKDREDPEIFYRAIRYLTEAKTGIFVPEKYIKGNPNK